MYTRSTYANLSSQVTNKLLQNAFVVAAALQATGVTTTDSLREYSTTIFLYFAPKEQDAFK